MNDFTKEELVFIRDELANTHHDSFDDVGYMIRKIQSLIEDYDKPCQHHWLTDTKMRFMSNPPKYKLMCSNCGNTKYAYCHEYDARDINYE